MVAGYPVPVFGRRFGGVRADQAPCVTSPPHVLLGLPLPRLVRRPRVELNHVSKFRKLAAESVGRDKR